MSLMSISSINRKISETKEQIKDIEGMAPEISQFMLSEMNRRLYNLEMERDELYKSQSRESISLRIYGENIESGKISNRILVSVLNGFQTTIDSIALALEGAEGERGRFTDKAKVLTDFQVAGTFAGSFGIVLEKEFEQIEIANNSSETAVVLADLFSILENSGDGIKLVETISPYGKRTVNHYKNWLKSLDDNNVNLEIGWVDDKAERRKINIRYNNVRETMFTLESINDIEVEDVIITNAKLLGLNIRNNTFEIETESGDIIRGKSKLENLVRLSSELGKEVSLMLTKSTSYTNTNIISVSWYLVKKLEESNNRQ